MSGNPGGVAIRTAGLRRDAFEALESGIGAIKARILCPGENDNLSTLSAAVKELRQIAGVQTAREIVQTLTMAVKARKDFSPGELGSQEWALIVDAATTAGQVAEGDDFEIPVERGSDSHPR